MKTIQRIILGCKDLPGYGPHPGTEILYVFIFIGAIAGASRGEWLGAIFGAAFMAVFMVPLYLIGAHGRGKDFERK